MIVLKNYLKNRPSALKLTFYKLVHTNEPLEEPYWWLEQIVSDKKAKSVSVI